MCVEILRTGLIFPRWLIWGVPRFTLKMNVMLSISLWVWNPWSFFKMITLKMNVSPSISLDNPINECWNPQKGSFLPDDRFEGSHAYIYLKNECFPIYLLGNCINVCWNPQNRACFPRWSIWGVTCLGLLSKWTLCYLSPWKPQNECWNPQNRACFCKTIDLRGHMPRFTLKMNVLLSISLETPKLCVETSEQGLFIQDNQFEGSHAYIYLKNEHFPIYLLGNPNTLCWNPQNRACSLMIDLRGHMPRFTLRMNVLPSISLETTKMCVNP